MKDGKFVIDATLHYVDSQKKIARCSPGSPHIIPHPQTRGNPLFTDMPTENGGGACFFACAFFGDSEPRKRDACGGWLIRHTVN